MGANGSDGLVRLPSWVYTDGPSVAPVPDDYDRIPLRTVRVPDELWQAAQRVAADRDEPLSAVIRRCLERYVRNHPLGDSLD